MREGLEESSVMVLQETVAVPDSAGTDELMEEEIMSSNGRSSHTPPVMRPYEPFVPYP